MISKRLEVIDGIFDLLQKVSESSPAVYPITLGQVVSKYLTPEQREQLLEDLRTQYGEQK
jgi:hypothetical protein